MSDLPFTLNNLAAVIQPTADPLPEGRRASAVLMALVEEEAGYSIILTERSPDLRHHAGQISFPGGQIDEGETVLDAALREAEEEIALPAHKVDVLGFLPGVVTTANFHIAPVLAMVNAKVNLVPAEAEVSRILIEPVLPLLDPGRHRSVQREYKGQRYQSWEITHEREYIWGATARILVQWSERIQSRQNGLANSDSKTKHERMTAT
ncbi:CoA pyrophosphatase [Alphaproteobacteria bacterium LSUCC0684]